MFHKHFGEDLYSCCLQLLPPAKELVQFKHNHFHSFIDCGIHDEKHLSSGLDPPAICESILGWCIPTLFDFRHNSVLASHCSLHLS